MTLLQHMRRLIVVDMSLASESLAGYAPLVKIRFHLTQFHVTVFGYTYLIYMFLSIGDKL
jgi:hypothetical protein